MKTKYRYHPIIEDLKVNEDGSEVIYKGQPLHISSFYIEESKLERKAVRVGGKSVTINRLVCECWHGLAPNRDYAATQVDETKGLHYSNLYWLKKGMRINPARHRKVTAQDHKEIQARIKNGESQNSVLKDYPFVKNTYLNFKNKYGKKEVK